MKKFNTKKWEKMRAKKAELAGLCNNLSEDFRFYNTEYHRLSASFFNHFQSNELLFKKINEDSRNLNEIEIENVIKKIELAWPEICDEFSLTPEFNSIGYLKTVYQSMLKKRKSESNYQRARRNMHGFSLSFHVLDEFARQFNEHEKTIILPPVEVF